MQCREASAAGRSEEMLSRTTGLRLAARLGPKARPVREVQNKWRGGRRCGGWAKFEETLSLSDSDRDGEGFSLEFDFHKPVCSQRVPPNQKGNARETQRNPPTPSERNAPTEPTHARLFSDQPGSRIGMPVCKDSKLQCSLEMPFKFPSCEHLSLIHI